MWYIVFVMRIGIVTFKHIQEANRMDAGYYLGDQDLDGAVARAEVRLKQVQTTLHNRIQHRADELRRVADWEKSGKVKILASE